MFAKGLNNKIHERAHRNNPLTESQRIDNIFKSRTRARVKHAFGSIKVRMHGTKLRSIGLMRAKFDIGLMNLTYNLKRVETLIRLLVFEFERVVASDLEGKCP